MEGFGRQKQVLVSFFFVSCSPLNFPQTKEKNPSGQGKIYLNLQ